MNAGRHPTHAGAMRPRRAASTLLLIGLVCTLFAPRLAGAQCRYELEWYDHPCPLVAMTGIDDDGNMVGIVCVDRAAVLWMDGSGSDLTFLEEPPNTGIAGSAALDFVGPDLIVGRADRAGFQAVRWGNGVVEVLEAPQLNGDHIAEAVNRDGVIVGQANFNNVVRPVAWIDGKIIAIELPHGPQGAADDVNELNEVTGWTRATGLEKIPFYHNLNTGESIILGLPPVFDRAEPHALNNAGVIVGSTVSSPSFAWRWRRGKYELLPLGSGNTGGAALDISDAGQIVGRGLRPPTPDQLATFAALWQDGQMYNLEDLVINLPVEPGAALRRATSVNKRGQIAVEFAGHTIARLHPLGSAPGDVDFNCTVNVSDLLHVLAEWGKEDSFADTDRDNDVDVFDVVQVLIDWG